MGKMEIHSSCYLGMGLLEDDYKVLVIQMKVYRDESVGEPDRCLGKERGN